MNNNKYLIDLCVDLDNEIRRLESEISGNKQSHEQPSAYNQDWFRKFRRINICERCLNFDGSKFLYAGGDICMKKVRSDQDIYNDQYAGCDDGFELDHATMYEGWNT